MNLFERTASLQENLGNALLASEIGTNRDKVTVDATTNRINGLLYKVHYRHNLCLSAVIYSNFLLYRKPCTNVEIKEIRK